MTLIDSVFRTGKNCYPQVFLEECKYVIKEKKIHNYITGDAEISDYDQDNSDDKIFEKITIKKNSDEEDSSERILVKKILMKKIIFFIHKQISSKST